MTDYLKILDEFGVPETVTDADAEYIRLKLARAQTSEEAEKYRKQLALLEQCLLVAHNERVKLDSRKKKDL